MGKAKNAPKRDYSGLIQWARILQKKNGTQNAARYLQRHGVSVEAAVYILC